MRPLGHKPSLRLTPASKVRCAFPCLFSPQASHCNVTGIRVNSLSTLNQVTTRDHLISGVFTSAVEVYEGSPRQEMQSLVTDIQNIGLGLTTAISVPWAGGKVLSQQGLYGDGISGSFTLFGC